MVSAYLCEITSPNFTKFSLTVTCGMARSSCGGVAVRYVVPVWRMTYIFWRHGCELTLTDHGAGPNLGRNLGPDLQNILQQSYDYLTIMPKLRITIDLYDRRLIYETSYEGRKAFLRYNSLAKS